MRSIGKIKIRKLKNIIENEVKNWEPLSMNSFQAQEAIKLKVPEDWFGTWECAYSEIERIISDEVSRIKYGR